MNRLLIRWLSAYALLLLIVLMPTARAAEPVTSVPELDISRYAGQWYEIARLPTSFQKDCASDVIAHYTLDKPSQLGVRNHCRRTDGGIKSAQGIARPVEGHPGRWKVRFAPDWLSFMPFVWADYWVIDLDPGYQWAMVGDPDREYLWVLSRTPGMDSALFERLTKRAEAMGYDVDALIMSAPLH
ncbi:lipocalin family protein [Pseudoxanthomonas sp. UTMC 1351]|uniref:lipocalin family protein n=1 Tax=Pseudoxanthomonas sp. UTMC 1351 TaxID=2695853 RepID=UPI0034CD5FD6